MTVTNHTINVWVDGVDQTSSLLKDSLYVRLQLKNHGSTAELSFINYTPPERAQVDVYVNSVQVFGGYIIRRSANLQGVKGQANVIWKCECVDWNELLNIPKINVEYVSKSDAFILNNLFTTYLPIQGFNATSEVTTLNNDITVSFIDVSLIEAIEQLAKLSGASWFISPTKFLHWFDRKAGTTTSFEISSSPNDSTKFGFLNNSLSYDIDSSSIINQVKIVGGVTSNGEKQTQTFTGTGSQKTFNLSEIPNSVAYVGYNDGSANYVTYGSFVGYEPQDKLISKGGSFLVVVNQSQKTITIEGNTGNAPGNGTTVTVEYYKKEIVASTYNNILSQNLFGLYPTTIENKEFSSIDQSETLAKAILDQNSYGKATLKFDTTKWGLLPGQRVTIDIAELDIVQDWELAAYTPEDGDFLISEDEDPLISEQYALGKDFLVQEVSLQPAVTAQNQFMIVCQVTCGKYLPDLIDALATVSELRSSRGIESQNPIPTRLSNISADLGEVQLGRAVFTDGGTARFNWGTPNAATGVIIGLEDNTGLEGAMYIYDQGTARVKLGKMDGLPSVGTVNPSGWGIYTENGYFQGVVAASQLIGGTITGFSIIGNNIQGNQITGGTITGGLISGGTVTGNLISGGTVSAAVIVSNTLTGNTISANTISGNQIFGGTITGTRVTGGSIIGNTIIGGTIATGTPPINSSNPGVVMDSTGLYGYGSAGLTFRLSSDPAIKPWFSSGTIINTTYEVNTASVIRTGTTNPRIQMDNSGIFGYDSVGVLKFSFDVSTGKMNAVDGNFSGTIESTGFRSGYILGTYITGNFIDGGTITGVQITGNQINGGTITSSVLNSGTINSTGFRSGYITGTYITGNFIDGGTITGVQITGNYINGGTITGVLFQTNSMYGNFISGGTVTSGLITSNTLNSNTISGGTITGNQITGGTITGGYITGGTVNGAVVQAASGNVYLDTGGLNLITTGSYSYGDQRNIKWRSSVGGSIAVEAASSWNGTYAEYWLQAGYPNFRYGIIHHAAYTNSGFGYSEIQQYPTQLTYLIDGNTKLQIDTNVTTYLNIIPDSSANNRQLGNSTNGFRYLYLKDDNGNVRRVSINSSGVLTVT